MALLEQTPGQTPEQAVTTLEPTLEPSPESTPAWTPEHIAGLLTARMSDRFPIRLACGVIMPPLAVTIQPKDAICASRLLIGDATTGQVDVMLEWDIGDKRLESVRLDSFFHVHMKTAAYGSALDAVSGGRTAPHVFMLLIDEIVHHAMIKFRANPECVIRLADCADLDKGRTAGPFALLGRTPFHVARDSRFLQWERGAAYYVTFGFWPDDEGPQDYLARSAALAHHQAGLAPGDHGYQQALNAIEYYQAAIEADGYNDLQAKQLPPVLPPTTVGGPLRSFRDMADYHARVLVPGSYGKLAMARPVERREPPAEREAPAPAPPELPELPAPPELPAKSMDDLLAMVARGERALPGLYGGIPARDGVVVRCGDATVEIGPYRIVVKREEAGPAGPGGPVARVTGPHERVAEVAALAEGLGTALMGQPAEVRWTTPRGVPQTYVVGGHKFERTSDRRFAARGVEEMHANGFTMEGVDVAALLADAAQCDDAARGGFMRADDPMFDRCARVARLLSRPWVRRPARKRPREP